MTEIGMSMEPPKKGIIEGLRRAFTMKGAKEQWYQDHKDVVLKYADLHNGLTDEQRAQSMAKLEADATTSAKINVGTKWAALGLTTATLGLAGGLVGSERFRNFIGTKGGKVGTWLATQGEKGYMGLTAAKFKAGELAGNAKAALIEQGDKAKDFLKSTWEKVTDKFKKKPSAPAASSIHDTDF